jgi:hypothetical protein
VALLLLHGDEGTVHYVTNQATPSCIKQQFFSLFSIMKNYRDLTFYLHADKDQDPARDPGFNEIAFNFLDKNKFFPVYRIFIRIH